MAIAADGRNLNDVEWRVVPEFPMYEVTSDGDLRNRDNKKLLNESENKRTGAYSYSIRKRLKDGSYKSTSRSYQSLVWDAFPELKPAPKEKPAPKNHYSKRGGWRVIPGYSKYQYHTEGAVRYVKGLRRIKPQINEAGEKCWRLFNEDGVPNQHSKPIIVTDSQLMGITFPENVQKEAA